MTAKRDPLRQRNATQRLKVVRLPGALVLTGVVGLVWLGSGSLVMYAFARLLAVIFNNEFTTDTRVDLARKIQRFPLPQTAASVVS
jgi:hypothetical protein